MNTIALRMPISSPMAPTIGSTNKPGMIHSAPSEKPRERTLGGMASDSAA